MNTFTGNQSLPNVSAPSASGGAGWISHSGEENPFPEIGSVVVVRRRRVVVEVSVSDRKYTIKVWNLTCVQAIIDHLANAIGGDVGSVRRMLAGCSFYHSGKKFENNVYLEEGDLVVVKPLGVGGGKPRGKQQQKIDNKQNKKINSLEKKVSNLNKKNKRRGQKRGRGFVKVPRVRGQTEVNKYVALRRDPWNESAWGACVPEGCRPTTPYVVRIKIGFSTNGSYAGEQVNIAYYPSACLCLYISDVTATGMGQGGSGTSLTSFSSNANYFYQMTASSLANTLACYRLVAGGVKLRSRAQSNQAQTTYNAIDLPISGHVNWNALNSLSLGANTFSAHNQLVNVPASSPILSYAGCREFTGYDIFQDSMKFVFKPVSEAAFNFRSTRSLGTQFNTETEAEDLLYVNATGALDTTNTGLHGTTDMDGWNCLLTQVYAAPNASSLLFTADIVLHYEGLSQLVSSSTMEPSAPRPKRGYFDAAREAFKAAKEPVITFAHEAARAAGEGFGYGMAGRLSNLEIAGAIQY